MSHQAPPTDQPAAPAGGIRRRDLLHTGARFLMLGGMLSYFVQQRLRAASLADDPTCIRLNTCQDCIEFSGCTLPKSHDHRQRVSNLDAPAR